MPPVTLHICRYCGKDLKCLQGVKTHLAQRPACRQAFQADITEAETRKEAARLGSDSQQESAMDIDNLESVQPMDTFQLDVDLPPIVPPPSLPGRSVRPTRRPTCRTEGEGHGGTRLSRWVEYRRQATIVDGRAWWMRSREDVWRVIGRG